MLPDLLVFTSLCNFPLLSVDGVCVLLSMKAFGKVTECHVMIMLCYIRLCMLTELL